MKAIVNISQHQLKGQYYTRDSTPIKWKTYLDIIARIEEMISKIPQPRTVDLKWKVRQILEKAKTLKSNITKLKRLAITTLQRNENIIIQKECDCSYEQNRIYGKTGRPL